MRNVSGNSCGENQNKNFILIALFAENHAVNEIVLKDTVEPSRTQTTILRMQIVFWIPKAINTFSEYVILIAFQQQHWLHERVSVLRCTCTACLVSKCYYESMQEYIVPS